MFRHNLLLMFRNFKRHKNTFFINLVGLSTGLTCVLFIFLWVKDELSFDKFHKSFDNIYKVMINNSYPDGRIETHGVTSAMLKGAIEAEIPEAEHVVQLSMPSDVLIRQGKKSFNEQGLYADPAIFSIFSFPFNGNKNNPLPDISSIAISEKLAEKFFGNEDPLGKVLLVNQSNELKVTSVFADVPQNSSLQFDFVLPFNLYVKENPWTQNWRSGGTQTLVTLKSGTSVENANVKLAKLVSNNCEDCNATPFLFEYANLRLFNKFENGKSVGGKIEQVVLFSAVASIILIMACINFMNLATARSATRSREVAVRKIIGAKRSGLIIYFIFEAVFLSFIALLLALGIVQLLLPFFNEITYKSVQLNFTDPFFLLSIFIITLTCGLLAGSYPAFFLSSVKPIVALKGNVQSALSGNSLRKLLVVVQFTASIVLIISSVVIYKQIVFISDKNLGFEKENVLVINRNEDLGKNYSAFKNELLQYSSVKSIGFGGSNILTVPITTTDPVWPGKPDNSSIKFKIFRCDEGFIPTMNIRFLAGRNFSEVNNQNISNYVINKSAMEVMGLTLENVIGTDLEMWDGKGKIIGLTDDFHNDNLRAGIEPLIFLYSAGLGSHYFIKIDGQTSIDKTLASIERTFKKYSSDYPFEFTFLDEAFDREYRTEALMGKLSLSFAIVTILISSLGLFGLASFMAERRTKELGIRKVLGASVSSIVLLLSTDFLKLVTLAIIIASPIAWWAMNTWLRDFSYKISLEWWYFIGTGALTIIITLLTVSFQAIKAATANPVKSLRTE